MEEKEQKKQIEATVINVEIKENGALVEAVTKQGQTVRFWMKNEKAIQKLMKHMEEKQ